MKKRIKPIIVDVIEDDGMWLDPETNTYYSNEQLEDVPEYPGLEEAAKLYSKASAIMLDAFEVFGRIQAFKAGAEWIANQGDTLTAIVGETGLFFPPELDWSKLPFEKGDIIEVTLKKKEK